MTGGHDLLCIDLPFSIIFNSDSTWPVKLRDFMGFKPNGIGGIGESWQKFLDDMTDELPEEAVKELHETERPEESK